MDQRDDRELLKDYAETRSQAAFAALVGRHINLVYASARRQCRGRDAHLVDDVTQAVFLVLARKAHVIRDAALLPAWLITTTRFTASNALALAARRRQHERRAVLMAEAGGRDEEVAVGDGDALTAVLDEALAKLGEQDRAAVTMRFLQGRSFLEVGAALGVSEEAAQKRVRRALEKLGASFRRRGVTAHFEALAVELTRQSAQFAPAALSGVVLAGVENATTAATATTAGELADATIKSIAAAAKAKLATVLAASILLVAGGGVAVTASLSRPRGDTAAYAAPTAVAALNTLTNPLVPDDAGRDVSVSGGDEVTFANADVALIRGANTTDYAFGTDPQVKRRPDGEPAAFIASLLPDAPLAPMPGMRGAFVPGAAWRGKRLEVSAYLRTQDARNQAGVKVLVWGPQRVLLARAMDGGRLVASGTTDWTRLSSVLDVPAEAQRIEFGVGLWGPGRVWFDSFTLREVPRTVPVTSDERWHVSTHWPSKFTLAADPSEPRAGRPAARLVSTATGVESAMLVRSERSLEPYRGKRVRVWAMIKAQDVTGGAGVFVKAGDFQAGAPLAAPINSLSSQGGFDGGRRYAELSSREDFPVRGTSGWMKYAATLHVPTEVDLLQYGVRFHGGGTIWIAGVVIEAAD